MRENKRILTAALAVLGPALLPLLFAAADTLGAGAASPGELPLRHKPENGKLPLDMANLAAVQVKEPFRYAGGQRFILKEVADAEQHFFIVHDSAGRISRLYWVQIEEMLPGKGGNYDYSNDHGEVVDGLLLFASIRTFENPPVAGSDRDAMYRYLKGRGFSLADVGTRLRLVYLPESPARREIMIIYLDTDPAAASATPKTLVERAKEGLTLIRRAAS